MRIAAVITASREGNDSRLELDAFGWIILNGAFGKMLKFLILGIRYTELYQETFDDAKEMTSVVKVTFKELYRSIITVGWPSAVQFHWKGSSRCLATNDCFFHWIHHVEDLVVLCRLQKLPALFQVVAFYCHCGVVRGHQQFPFIEWENAVEWVE